MSNDNDNSLFDQLTDIRTIFNNNNTLNKDQDLVKS
jgi:hypothetical protein